MVFSYIHLPSGGDKTDISSSDDGKIVIQYWFFYVFNEAVNDHEGDWEMIEIMLPPSDDPLSVTPSAAGYSQHYGGEKRSWTHVPREGNNPIVYVEEGGHASNFNGGGEYTIRWDQGCEYNIEILGNQKWLSFRGIWGGTSGEGGSVQGPVYRHTKRTGAGIINPRWDAPEAYIWIDSLYWKSVIYGGAWT